MSTWFYCKIVRPIRKPEKDFYGFCQINKSFISCCTSHFVTKNEKKTVNFPKISPTEWMKNENENISTAYINLNRYWISNVTVAKGIRISWYDMCLLSSIFVLYLFLFSLFFFLFCKFGIFLRENRFHLSNGNWKSFWPQYDLKRLTKKAKCMQEGKRLI